jgi:hypothetical protein
MAVPMPEFKDFDSASARLDGIGESTATGAGQSGLAVVFQSLVQRLGSRRREGIASTVEPLVEVAAARLRGLRPKLLEVPAQFVERFGPEGVIS